MSRPQWQWKVPEPAPAGRADKAILEALSQDLGNWSGEAPSLVSRSMLQRWFDESLVQCQGQPLKASARVLPHQVIEITIPEVRKNTLTPENFPLEILFEDEHLLVLNKPQGLTVHPSSTQETGTLVHALLHKLPELPNIGGAERPGIVHRLDKDTSGVMVVAKTQESHVKLVELFSRHEIERKYWALTYGTLKQKHERVETLIGRNPNDRTKMSANVKDGRRAVTHFTLLESYLSGAVSWIEAKLETGRTHQVRVHLTAQGCSILGDPVYGVPSSKHPKWVALPAHIQKSVLALPGQALHARVLGFIHPITQQKLHFEGEPPEAFKTVLDQLQRAHHHGP